MENRDEKKSPHNFRLNLRFFFVRHRITKSRVPKRQSAVHLTALWSGHLIFIRWSQKNWQKKACFRYFVEKVRFSPVIYKKLYIIWLFLKQKVCFSWILKKNLLRGNPLNIKWPLPYLQASLLMMTFPYLEFYSETFPIQLSQHVKNMSSFE